MTAAPYLTSSDPLSAAMTSNRVLTLVMPVTPTPYPWMEEEHIQVHTILIVIIFCVVCFLLLVAFFYAFCIRCTLKLSPKDSRPAHSCSLEREDATFCRSSSDCQSVGNVV